MRVARNWWRCCRPAESAEEHLPGAINLPLKQLDATTAARLDRDPLVVVYCSDAL